VFFGGLPERLMGGLKQWGGLEIWMKEFWSRMKTHS
jgi:hypothetical protein